MAAAIYTGRRPERHHCLVAQSFARRRTRGRREPVMNLLPGWHPMVVHFPLALGVVAALSLLAARLLRAERHSATLATLGTWNLCLGAFAALFALGTGLAATIHLQAGPEAHQAIALHMKWAVSATL